MINHDGMEYAGYLSFLMLISLFPAIIFLFWFIGKINLYVEHDAAVLDLFIKLLDLRIFSDLLIDLKPEIKHLITNPPTSSINIAFISILWSASSSLEGIRSIFNRAYRVVSPPIYIFRRVLSIFQFILASVIVAIVVITITFLPSIIEKTHIFNKFDLVHKKLFYYLISIVSMISIVSWIHIVLPNRMQKFYVVIPGTVLTVIIWLMSIGIFRFYLKKYDNIYNIYGGMHGIIIIMLFFYIMHIGLIYGAEFNYSLIRYRKYNKRPRIE